MGRLSTGLRINSAADDAAGMAIAEGFTSQIRGLSQAVRNASEALSLAQTAESALSETTDILQRVRELAVQASNTTLTSSDRSAIQNEVSSLISEIDRIAGSTQYNSSNILDGSAKQLTFQVGDKIGQTVSMSIDSAKSADLGLAGAGAASSGGLVVGGKVDGTATVEHDDILINGVNFAASNAALTASNAVDPVTGAVTALAYTSATAAGVAAQINSNTGNHGVVASAQTTVSGDSGSGVTAAGGTITMTGFDSQVFTIRATSGMDDMIAAINEAVDITVTKNARGGMDIVDTKGRTMVFASTFTTGTTGLASLTNTGHVSLSSVDGKSDIVIAGASTVDDASAPNVNTSTAGVGERVSAANSLGLNFGTYSYTGATTVTTGQLGRTLLAGTDTLTINGVKLGNTAATVTAAANVTASDLAAAFNAVSAESGVTATAKNTVIMQMQMNDESAILSTDTQHLLINGVASTTSTNMALSAVVTALNSDHLAANTGLTFVQDGSSVVINSGSGGNISITDAAAAQIVNVIHADGDELDEAGADTTPANDEVYAFRGFLELSNANGDVVLGTTATNDDAFTTAETLAGLLGMELSKKSGAQSSGGMDLSSATKASAALASVDAALSAVNTIRGGLGAVSNRLDHTVSSLTKTVENHTASRSRIMDADFAAESAALSKAQVLAQASTAMLAQANAAPQLALQLLQ
jgi:flagellin